VVALLFATNYAGTKDRPYHIYIVLSVLLIIVHIVIEMLCSFSFLLSRVRTH